MVGCRVTRREAELRWACKAGVHATRVPLTRVGVGDAAQVAVEGFVHSDVVLIPLLPTGRHVWPARPLPNVIEEQRQ